MLPGRCPGLYGISGVRGQGGVDWSYPHPWGGRDVEVGRCGGFEAITSNLSQDAFAGPCRLGPLVRHIRRRGGAGEDEEYPAKQAELSLRC